MAKGRVAHDEYIRTVVRAYGQVQAQLAEHHPAFPTEEALQARVKGNGDYGMAHVGPGHDSAGSDWIIAAVDSPDPRPPWVAVGAARRSWPRLYGAFPQSGRGRGAALCVTVARTRHRRSG